MREIKYNKLVRDLIPEIIEAEQHGLLGLGRVPLGGTADADPA